MTIVDSFECTLTWESFPPSVAAIDEALANEFLGQAIFILHWAIVRSDATTQRLWLEGSLVKAA